MYVNDITNLATLKQNLTVGNSQIHSHLIYTSTNGKTGLCVWPQQDYLKCYNFNGATSTFDATPYFTGSIQAPTAATPGGILSLSSNNNQDGTHVIWATLPHSNADQGHPLGDLYAFNPEGSSQPIWSSSDTFYFAQFNPPAIANGKVYRPTFSNAVCCYS